MLIRRIKREYFLYYSLYMALCTAAGAVFYHVCAPHYAFKAFWLIPIWFYLFGLFTGATYIFVERMMPHLTVHYHLIQKGVKFFLSMVIILSYAYFDEANRKAFLLTYLAYYFLNMGYELWFFCRIEMIKKMIERDNHSRKRYRRLKKQ
ncbi:MAG: hypothetical protein IJX44_08975 [Bacteroidaceae bacterium]|nr:hypothetical protein [Bacteroidaceae bacterium]